MDHSLQAPLQADITLQEVEAVKEPVMKSSLSPQKMVNSLIQLLNILLFSRSIRLFKILVKSPT